MRSQSTVKLYLYEEKGKETVVESFEAEDWDSFMIVRLSADQTELMEATLSQLEPIAEDLQKKLIVIAGGLDVKFYGVREYEEDNDD